MKVTITRDVLESCLLGAQESYPREFLGMLAGTRAKDEIRIDRLYLAPLTESDEGSVHFDEFNLPIALGVVGTFHSHPSGQALPSKADLRMFSRKGSVHLVACRPFGAQSVRAFDLKGKELPFSTV
jgi:proteasome lid subunit RPN8/RPN11